MRSGIIAAVVAVIITAFQTVYFVDETELAIVTQFGEYKRSVTTPGINYKKPFLQQVQRMERRILGSDTPPAEYLTLDKKRIVVDPVTRWRIAEPFAFFIALRDEDGARRRIDDIIKSEMRSEIASHNFQDIVGNARDPLMQRVTARSREQTTEFGVTIVDVRIKRADLPRQVQESVYARMRAERERVAKRYRAEGAEEAAKMRAETDKKQTILLAEAYQESENLRGEGDALSTKIYADSYGKDAEFYAFTRSLLAYEKALNKDSTIVLSTKGALFKYLNDPKRR